MQIRVSITEEQWANIATRYTAGEKTQQELAIEYGVSLATINKKLKDKQKPEKQKYTKNAEKAERDREIIKAFNLGKTLREIATEFNITHQAVSLIIQKHGFNPAESRKELTYLLNTTHRENEEELRNKRVEMKLDKIEEFSNLWKSGATMEVLRVAMDLGSVNAAAVKIVLLRKEYGLDLFPYRKLLGEEQIKSAELASSLWKAGATMEEIRVAFKLDDIEAARRKIMKGREKYGAEMFPYRRNVDTQEEVNSSP